MKKAFLILSTGIILIFASIYYFFSNSPVALERKLHRILTRLPKITEGAKCLSPYDCKMEVLPVVQCVPRDFLYTYSKREPEVKEIQENIREYKEAFKQLYPKESGTPRCLIPLEPQSKCVEGKCMIHLSTGEKFP